VKAATDIPYCFAFSVEGVNSTNPVTFEDVGYRALFAATRDIKCGDEIKPEDYTPQMRTEGPYRNVTRLPADDSFAFIASVGPLDVPTIKPVE